MSSCANCGADQPVGAKFCNECGSTLTQGCPACGSAITPGAKFCNECGADLRGEAAAPRDQPATAIASRRLTSVLFGDLVGFTPFSEARDQEDVRELLSRYFEECSRIVGRYGGVVEKFIGDAVMAVWGVPTTNEDDAERSVRAGLELVAAATALGSEVGVSELAMRVGIVTGEVAVTVGAQMQGMVAGDPVNTAARVQSAAAPGQVWVDETTRLLTSASISYADVGSHQLKGKTEPMPLWAARAVIATAGGAQRADGLETPIVGLDRELRMVKEAFHRVEDSGRPALLVVVGDAGTGKSRLGWEFSKYTDGLAESCRWHSGRCVSYGEGVAYYALAEAVRSRLETGSGLEEPYDGDQLVERGLAAYVADPEERAWLAPRLAALLGTAGTSSFPRDDLYAAWTTFFERVSDGTEPVVMMIDDAQYADEGLLRFAEHLLAAGSFPCLVVLLSRPEILIEHPELVTNRRSTVLHVDPLTTDEMSSLVDGLVQGLPPEVRDVLVDRAEGIPTYAVETVRALIDRDLVVPRGGAYVLADPEALDLATIGPPASLQALISARLDRLTPDERRVVDRASVAGGSVEPALLAELCDDVSSLDLVLSGLVRAEIFSVDQNRLSSEQGRYQFVQSAVRQVAYATLSRRERKQTHLQLLDAMTRDDSPELAPVAAQHAVAAIESAPDDADVPELHHRAVALLRVAAARAHALGAPTEAAGHLGRALDHVGEGQERFEIDLADAMACIDIGRYDDAVTLASEARTGFASSGDFLQEALAAATLGRALIGGPGEMQQAVDLLEPYHRRLATMPEAAGVHTLVLRSYTSALSRLGNLTYDLGLEYIKTAERAGDLPSVARGLSSLAVDMLQTGYQLVGIVLLDRAVDVARETHSFETEAHALATLSAAWNGEDLQRALTHARAAVEVGERGGNLDSTSLGRSSLARAWWAVGDWDAVAALDLAGFHPDDEAEASALVGLVLTARGESPDDVVGSSARRAYGSHWGAFGDALVAAHRGEPSAPMLTEAVHLVFESGGVFDETTAVFGAVLAQLSDPDGDALLDHLAQVLDGSGERLLLGLRAHRDLIEALRLAKRGDADDEIARRYESAISSYEAWGSPVYVARGRASYAAWLSRQGRAAEAEPLVAQARATYAELGAVTWLAELDDALAGVSTS